MSWSWSGGGRTGKEAMQRKSSGKKGPSLERDFFACFLASSQWVTHTMHAFVRRTVPLGRKEKKAIVQLFLPFFSARPLFLNHPMPFVQREGGRSNSFDNVPVDATKDLAYLGRLHAYPPAHPVIKQKDDDRPNEDTG